MGGGKSAEENFWEDEYIHYLVCGDIFTSVHIYQNSSR